MHGQKEKLESRLSEILNIDFIRKKVCPLSSESSDTDTNSQGLKAAVVQNTGTGRITVQYQIGKLRRVFGKLYTDDLGVYGYSVLKGLWVSEFGRDERYRVPEPLFYLPEYCLLITKEADGISLDSLAREEGSAFLEGVSDAARWLVKLHKCKVRIGRPEELWVKFFNLGRSLAKTARKRPAESEELVKMMEKLENLAREAADKAIVVQTHGRFHQEHIFVCDGAVTAIDLDRSCPSDPAKDLAEFLYMLRFNTFKLTGDQAKADAATKAFLEEYISHLPGHLKNLAFFWSYNILFSLSRFMRRHTPEEHVWQPRLEFAVGEFNDIISGKLPTCLLDVT